MTALALSSPGCDAALAVASLPSQQPDRDRSPLPYRKLSDGASVPFSSSGAEDRSDEEEYDITSFRRERMFDILLWKYDDDPARQFEDERRSRVEELVSEGLFSKACALLLSEPLVEIDSDVVAEMKKEHPTMREEDKRSSRRLLQATV